MAAQTELVLQTVVKGTEKATKALNDVKGSLNGMGAEAKSLGSRLTSVGGSIVKFGAIAGTAIGSLGALGLKMAGDFEQTSIAFKTMLGDGNKASALLKDLSKFAAETPFEFPEIANAGKSLLAFGVEAGNIQPTLRRLGDVASSLNIPLGEISEIYGKAKVQGRLFAEDINQLTGRGIPVIGELAKVLGTTESNMKLMVKEGQVGFPELQKAFENMTNEGGKFAGGMKNQSQSLNGLLSTAKDNLGNLLREIIGINMSGEVVVGSILDKAKNLTTGFITFTETNKETIKAMLDGMLDGFTKFFGTLGEIIGVGFQIIQGFWTQHGESIKSTVQSIVSEIVIFWKEYGDEIMTVLNGIGFVFARAFDGLKLVIQSTMWIIGPLVHDVMTAIGGAFKLVAGIITLDFGKAVDGFKDLFSGIIQTLGDIVIAFVDLIARAFGSDIVKTIDGAMNYLGEKARQAKALISDILSATASIGNSFSIQGVSSMISGARADGGPVGSGKSYLVGERGPEIFTPRSSGQIIPNNRIGGASGGITINISGLFGQNAADEIGQHIVNRLKGASYI